MKKNYMLLVAILLPILATACKRESQRSHVTDLPEAGESASMGMGMDGGMENAGGDVAVGVVVETMPADKYTYVQIDTGTEKIWGAALACDVKVGERLGISKAQPMVGFKSKTLDRVFDVVYFVAAFQKPDGTPLGGSGHGMTGQTAMGRASGSGKVDVGSIEKPAGGKTVAEIYAEKADLAGKEITLRGQVTKYNAHILGVNWLHVQDGSGDEAAKTHDLTVTTLVDSKVGDTVLITGKLVLNKDFGAGYKYALIIEDATVVVE